jgi:hypothetical protein
VVFDTGERVVVPTYSGGVGATLRIPRDDAPTRVAGRHSQLIGADRSSSGMRASPDVEGVVVVRGSGQPGIVADVGLAQPRQPAASRVQGRPGRGQRAEPERPVHVLLDRVHEPRSVAAALAARQRRDRLDVAGREAVPARLQFAFDDRGVGDDRSVLVEHEVRPAECVAPVLVPEPVHVGEGRVE